MLMWCTLAMVPVGVLVFVEVGGGSFSSTGLSLSLSGAVRSSRQPLLFSCSLERLAGKRAAQYLADGTEYKGMSLKKKLAIGVLGALPSFFVVGMMMMYVTIVF